MTVLSLQQGPSSPPPPPQQQAQADGTFSPIPAELQVDPAQYELLDYQARGGFGCVFTAIHIPTGQKVAIKLFDYIHCKPSDPAYVDVEIESMCRVRHIQGFARLLGCFYDSEEGIATGRQVRYWSTSGEREFVDTARKLGAQKHGVRRQKVLVLELCQGGEVFDRINLLAEQGRSFELVHASDIVRSVCATFQQLHASRLINPDFKPENCVFVSPDLSLFEVKVIDLGAMCHVPEGQSEIVNRDALITPSLQAPESHQRGVFSFKSDVFQVGCFLFMILAAAVPFDDYGRKSRDFDHWMGAIRARSVAAHDLLCRLLCPSPDERISVPDILRHPFIAEPQSLAAVGAGGSGPDAAYIERVRGLLLRKRLRVLLQACAEVGRRQREAVLQLELAQSEQQAAGEGAGAGAGAGILDLGRLAAKLDGGVFVQLKARFLEKCGHDVKSEISKEAFRSILQTCDEPSLRVLADERIFDRVSGIFDSDNSGLVSYTEFAVALTAFRHPDNPIDARSLFEILDLNSDNALTLEELRPVLGMLLRSTGDGGEGGGEDDPEGALTAVFKAIDADGSKTVDFHEFRAFFESNISTRLCRRTTTSSPWGMKADDSITVASVSPSASASASAVFRFA